jgi:mannose-6-phosphate isomerase-like protein (cupin superfamily)
VADRTVEDPVLRQRLAFRRERGEDGRETLVIDTWVAPGGGVTPHVHPTMDERFEVVSGRGQFLSGREWVELGPGKSVDLPAGTRHAYRNRSDAELHTVCRATPPESLEDFLVEVAALSRAGMLMRPGLPRSPRGLLYALVMARRHRPMVVLELPPPALQRLADPLARWAERLVEAARNPATTSSSSRRAT